MFKKVLSLIISLSMVLAMMSGVLVSHASTGDPVTYTYAIKEDVSGLDNAESVKGIEITNTKNAWQWHSSNINTVRKHNFGIEANAKNVGAYFALEITIPTSGEYKFTLGYGRSKTNAGYGDVYFMPKDITTQTEIENAIEKSTITSLGEVAYYDAEKTTETTIDLKNITVLNGEEGKRVIAFVSSKMGPSDYRMYVSSLELERIGDAPEAEPGVQPEEPTEEGYTFTYDLNPQEYGGNENTNQQYLSRAYDDYSDTNGMWKWAGKTTEGLVRTYHFNRAWISSDVQKLDSNIYGIVIASQNKEEWAAVKLATPVSGDYNATLTYGKHANGGLGDVYLLPGNEDIATVLKNATALNVEKINYHIGDYTSAYGNNIYKFENKVTVTAPESWLVFRVEEAGSGNKFQMFPQSFTLTSGSGNKTYFMHADASASDIEVGGKTSISVTPYMSNGEECTEDYNVTYATEDTGIISLDGDGTVTGLAAGTATVNCTVTIDDVIRNVPATVRVTDKAVELQNTITMSVTGSDGKVTVDGAVQEIATQTYSKNIGASVTVVAEDIEGKIFRGWLRGGENGTVVWLGNEYTFTAATNVALFAKYTAAPAENAEAKEYYDWNGEFLAYDSYDSANLSKYGFKFTNWLPNVIGKVTRYVANYDADNTYEITKPDGVTADVANLTSVPHETKITLTNENPVSWYVNNKLAAYGTSYTFLATENATVTIDNKVQKSPIAKLDKVNDGTYILEYNENGKNVIEKGIIIGGNETSVASCFHKVISQRNDASGKLMAKNDTAYTTVRGYIIYEDGNTHRVVYADIAE